MAAAPFVPMMVMWIKKRKLALQLASRVDQVALP
jgi:hypothetical protein